MLWLIVLILLIILLLLIYLIFSTRVKCPIQTDYDHIKNMLQKSNNFIQDICEQINEKDRYVVLPGDDNAIENNNIYVNIVNKKEIEIYETIIRLLSVDIAKKNDVKDIETTNKRIEQAAYTQGYLTRIL